MSRCIGDPDVIDHQQGFAPPTVAKPSYRQCDSPTWSHTAFLSRFHTCCRSPFWLHNRRRRLLGGEPWGEPAISHDSHHVSLVQWTNLFASRHKGHRFKSPGGYLCETGILLLAMSRYNISNANYKLFRSYHWLLCAFLVNIFGGEEPKAVNYYMNKLIAANLKKTTEVNSHATNYFWLPPLSEDIFSSSRNRHIFNHDTPLLRCISHHLEYILSWYFPFSLCMSSFPLLFPLPVFPLKIKSANFTHRKQNGLPTSLLSDKFFHGGLSNF